MGNDDGWRDEVHAAAERRRESCRGRCRSPRSCARRWTPPWPTWPTSASATAAMMPAAAFLREFVPEGGPWAHVDIAGPAFIDATAVGLQRQGRHRVRRADAGRGRRADGRPAGLSPASCGGAARHPRPSATGQLLAGCAAHLHGPERLQHPRAEGPPRGRQPVRCRDPRRRQRRLRLRPARRPARAVRGPDREGQARRHLPAPRLHPDQGPAARGRGGRHRTRERAVRRQHDPRGIDMPARSTPTATASSAGSTRACRGW